MISSKIPFLRILIIALLPAVAGVLYAIGLPEEEEQGLSFDNAVSAYYDSNIVGNKDGDSDVEATYSPTLNFTRQAGLIGLSASVGGSFGFFVDHDEFNYQLFRSNLMLDYPNEAGLPYIVTLSGGYNETSDVDTFSGRRLERSVGSVAGSFRYNVNERWGFRVSGNWSDLTYSESGLSSQTSYGAGLDFVYIYSEFLDIFLGYSYRETSARFDSQDQTFRLQMEGELTPKITGTLGLGYQIRETDFDNSGDPYVNLDLAWAVNERFEVVATGGISFFTTSAGSSGQRTSVGLAGVMALGGDLSASLGVTYQEQDYESFGLDRSDEFLSYRAGLAWQLGLQTSLSASVTYMDVDSTIDRLTYDRLRAGLDFTFTF